MSEPVIQDKSLPHQIQLVFANKQRRCVNGEVVNNSEVAVTCNCYRIGQGDHFVTYIAPAPTLEAAWAEWNYPKWHQNQKTFIPRERQSDGI